MSKTPVSALQEYMQKGAHGIPEYVIVAEKNGTHLPSFTYRVRCGKLYAQGTASTKKEAKHNAAREMLQLLPGGYSSQGSSPRSSESSPRTSSVNLCSPNTSNSSEDGIFINFVGKLNEYCVSSKLKFPEYTEIGASGPSHNRMFTVKCSVGSLSANATASTKKQAKQEAAQNVHEQLIKTTTSKSRFHLNESNALRKCYGEAKTEIAKVAILDLKMPELSMPSKQSAEKAKGLFVKMRGRDSSKTGKDVQVNDYHEALKMSTEKATRETVQQKMRMSTQICSSEMLLNNVLEILNLELECQTMASSPSNCVFRCTVNSSPVITDIGIGKTIAAAKEQAMGNLLKSIDLLLT